MKIEQGRDRNVATTADSEGRRDPQTCFAQTDSDYTLTLTRKKEGQMTFGHESLGNPGTAPSLQDADDDDEGAICMPLSDKALSADFRPFRAKGEKMRLI